jgi:hypothetical protein
MAKEQLPRTYLGRQNFNSEIGRGLYLEPAEIGRGLYLEPAEIM